nr:MAG: ORF3 [Giant panda anellovirus]
MGSRQSGIHHQIQTPTTHSRPFSNSYRNTRRRTPKEIAESRQRAINRRKWRLRQRELAEQQQRGGTEPIFTHEENLQRAKAQAQAHQKNTEIGELLRKLYYPTVSEYWVNKNILKLLMGGQ